MSKFGLSPSECENSYSPACLANLNSYGGGGGYGMTPHFNYFDPSGGYFPTLGVHGLGQFNYQGGQHMANVIEILPGVPPADPNADPISYPQVVAISAQAKAPVVLPNAVTDLFAQAKAYAQANPLITLAVGGGLAYLFFKGK